MATPDYQINDGTGRALVTLSQLTGKSISEILEKAVEEYRRKLFFEGVDKDFAGLRADPDAWSEEVQERRLSENSLMDGLDPNDLWTDSPVVN